jgi:hypothetical protein
MSAVVVALEVGGSGFAEQIAVDALIIDIKSSAYVLGIFICCVGHVPSGNCRARLGRNVVRARIFADDPHFGATALHRTSEKWVWQQHDG